jgi:hypothetical protein
VAALKEKVFHNWLRSMGFHAPKAGQFNPGPRASNEVNAQHPNKKYKRAVSGKKRKPRYRTF